MFEKLSESSGNVFGFKMSGTLTDEDYRVLVPQLEKAIEECGKINVLMEMVDFHGWDMKATWDDLKFDVKHAGDIGRIAMVGEKKWEEWMAKLSKPFFRGEVRYFDGSQIQEAWDWLREAD